VPALDQQCLPNCIKNAPGIQPFYLEQHIDGRPAMLRREYPVTIMAGSDYQVNPRPKTPTPSNQDTEVPKTPKKIPRSPSSVCGKSPRSPRNMTGSLEQQRRSFLHHLTEWSANHDASPYFHGKISLVTQSDSVETIGLGKSLKCVLTDTTWTDARKQVVIRLFPPGIRDARYKLVIRYGSSWMSARDFMSKEYFNSKHAEQVKKENPICYATSLDDSLQRRSSILGPKPLDKDSVSIQPLFLQFLKLPLELQQMILGTAAGVTGRFLSRRRASYSRHTSTVSPSPISLATMMSISKALNSHLVPWIYHTTDFQFGTTGFTSFLWLSGPVRRAELKRVTFKFSDSYQNGLVHCLRWLAPDPILELFDPPVPTSPAALCYLWRCQLMDLAKELHLAVLTIDLYGVLDCDLPLMVRILRQAFGSVEHIRFKNDSLVVEPNQGLKEKRSWREECRGFFERRKGDRAGGARRWLAMSDQRRKMGAEGLERDMDCNREFFDQVECAWG
jgi:hypothetical protein